MIKNGFFTKINYSMIVSVFKQLCDRRHREGAYDRCRQNIMNIVSQPVSNALCLQHLTVDVSALKHQVHVMTWHVTKETRHRASKSMYSLTFRVRVTTPLQCGQNGTASLQITSRTQLASRFCRWRGESSPACVVRAACGWPGGLPLGCATHF